MPITALDEKAALIVMDLQAGTAANHTAHPAGEVVARAAELLSAFRRRKLPVVLANVDGTPPGRTEYSTGARIFPASWSELLPELDQQAEDLTLTRRTWSVFAGTKLAGLLKDRGISQVVLAGMATSFGIESTARDAYDLGYNVALVLDAITDPDAEAHLHTVSRVFPALGETGMASEIIKLLEGR